MLPEKGIQIIAFAQLLNAFVALIIASRLSFAYQKFSTVANAYYMKFYFFSGLFFAIIAGSQYLFVSPDNGMAVGVFNVVAFFFLNLGIGYLLSFPFLITGKSNIAKDIIFFVFLYSAVFTVLRFLYLQPSEWIVFTNYAYWKPVYPVAFRVITGMYTIGTGITVTVFFFKRGFDHVSNVFIFRKSFLLGIGGVFSIGAGMLGFVAGPAGNFFSLLVASFLSLVGFIIIMVGVYYHETRQTEKPVQ